LNIRMSFLNSETLRSLLALVCSISRLVSSRRNLCDLKCCLIICPS
jgi:hypothetical protein